MQAKEWSTAMRDLPGPIYQRPARLAKRLVNLRRESIARRLTSVYLQRLSWSPLREDVLLSADLERVMRESAGHSSGFRTLNSYILGKRLGPDVSTRASECSIVAASYGIDYRWPLLDRRLVQQYISTPSVWKYGEGFGRYIHRRAVSGLVPDQIAWKPSKSMHRPGEPTRSPAAVIPRVHFSDLHPTLSELVDADRLDRLSTVGAAEYPFVFRQITRRLDSLNKWLYGRV